MDRKDETIGRVLDVDVQQAWSERVDHVWNGNMKWRRMCRERRYDVKMRLISVSGGLELKGFCHWQRNANPPFRGETGFKRLLLYLITNALKIC